MESKTTGTTKNKKGETNLCDCWCRCFTKDKRLNSNPSTPTAKPQPSQQEQEKNRFLYAHNLFGDTDPLDFATVNERTGVSRVDLPKDAEREDENFYTETLIPRSSTSPSSSSTPSQSSPQPSPLQTPLQTPSFTSITPNETEISENSQFIL